MRVSTALAQRAESGVGVLRRDSQPLPPARASGERCKLPQLGSPGSQAVMHIFKCTI